MKFLNSSHIVLVKINYHHHLCGLNSIPFSRFEIPPIHHFWGENPMTSPSPPAGRLVVQGLASWAWRFRMKPYLFVNHMLHIVKSFLYIYIYIYGVYMYINIHMEYVYLYIWNMYIYCIFVYIYIYGIWKCIYIYTYIHTRNIYIYRYIYIYIYAETSCMIYGWWFRANVPLG